MAPRGRHDPRDRRTATRRDPGAYIGRLPERATETIPGGSGPRDDRGTPPEAHREAASNRDDQRREAGQGG